jgi:DNA-directed RNA polymerase
MSAGLDNNWEFIFTANEPFLFLACVLELQEYYRNPTEFKSSLSVYLDATCSGLQHLASMVKDENLSKYVNLAKSTCSNKPYDLYQIMADKVLQSINKLDVKERVSFLELNINRKFVKTGIMTIPYGATITGISEQLKSQFFRVVITEDNKTDYKKVAVSAGLNKQSKFTKKYLLINNEFNSKGLDLYFTDKQLYKLAKIIYNVLYDSHPSLTLFINYLKSMNKFLKNLNLNNV